jgi:anti-sigma-K factor RskA
MNPRELLPDYVLGLLSPEETKVVEAYLLDSSVARAELATLQETFVKLTESVPSETPKTSWKDVQRRLAAGNQAEMKRTTTKQTRTRPVWHKQLREWRNYALAASLALAIIGFSWGLSLQRQLTQTRTEQNKLSYWLNHDDARTMTLKPISGTAMSEGIGLVLLLPDGRCLFILKNAPPPDKSYQAWGQDSKAEQDKGQPISLGVSNGRLIEVSYTGYDTIGVSLEPKGGSPAPTQPLGRTSLW